MRIQGIRAALRRIGAVAAVTIREVFRKKFFLVGVVFVLALISVFGLAPGLGPEAMLRVLQTWIFRAATFFLCLVAVVLAGFSLPSDIERRTIYNLASKPISKVSIVLGRFVGFVAVLLISIGGMALVAVLMLRGTQYVLSLREPEEGRPRTFAMETFPRAPAPVFVPLRVHFRGRPVRRRVVLGTGDEGTIVRWYAERGTGVGKGLPLLRIHTRNGERDILSPWTGIVAATFFAPGVRVGPGSTVAEIDDFEAYGLRGENLDLAFRFVFTGLDPSDFDMLIPLRIRLEVGNSIDPFDRSADLRLRIRNPDSGAEREVNLPGVLSNEWTAITFPRTYIGRSGALEIDVLRTVATDEASIRMDRYRRGRCGIEIFGAPEIFELSLLKGLGLVLLEAVFLLAMVLAVSTFLSGPVTVFFGLTLYLLGSMHGFVAESVRDVSQTLETREAARARGERVGRTDLPEWVLRASLAGSSVILGVFPSFDLLDPMVFLVEDVSVPFRALGRGLAEVGVHILAALAIGCVVIHLRDFT